MSQETYECIDVLVNERPFRAPADWCVRDLVTHRKPDADVVLRNGFPASAGEKLCAGDQVVLIRRGEAPKAEELEALLVARHGPGVHGRVKHACVGIAGCGGLGSNVAISLARTGVGAMVLVDFDCVEPSNLNRQQYFVDQIGLPKVDALAANLARINPYVRTETHAIRVTHENAQHLFAQCDVVAECFDSPTAKAELARSLARATPRKPLVTVSGIAGFGPASAIGSRRVLDSCFLVGDTETAAAPGRGLLAPRVAVAAGHQANIVLRLLLGVIGPTEGG